MTIHLYGKTYAPNARHAVETLFQAGGTANGLYKVTSSGIRFYGLNGELRAFVRKDGLGPVSATMRDDGRAWYMFGLADRDAAWMAAPESYMATCNGARDLAASLFQGKA
jgi:hypothetical protein